MKTGQLSFDLRSRAGAKAGDRRSDGTARLPEAGATPVRVPLRKRPRVARQADEKHVRELIRLIYRMWREDKDLIYAIHGIQPLALDGRQREGQ